MKKWIFLGWCMLYFANWGQAQKISAQSQEVHYRIDGKLDTLTHSLTAQMQMVYINHSSDSLKEIVLHLWANAYQDRNTTFAQELLNRGETHFHFRSADEKGGYRALHIQAERRDITIEHTAEPDIARLPLHRRLGPGDTLTLDMNYTLQIPLSFSRLGRTADSYQLTQWYPKPAVYHKGRWITFPYADQGEFFSEWGQFEVYLDAPGDFLVLATGNPDKVSEARLRAVAESGLHYSRYVERTSVPGRQQWKYTATDVHDFALFLDRNFRVDHKVSTLKEGKSIDIWAAYTPKQAALWAGATEYMGRAISFFSSEIGPYPYAHCTAVEGALSAGAGMEYPMITIIGEAADRESLDRVLAHEIGHNWWYGILASNERKSAWIDEGLTSFYEELYMKTFYGAEKLTLDRYWKEENWALEDALCSHQYRMKKWQHPALSSEQFEPLNYYLVNYHWAPKAFQHLRNAVGPMRFRAAIQSFYREEAFSHIDGEGLQTFLEEAWDVDLDWLFESSIQQGKFPEYGLTSVQQSADSVKLLIQNPSQVEAPFQLSFFSSDSLISSQWESGFTGTKKYTLSTPSEAAALILNPNKLLLEPDFSDNIHVLSPKNADLSSWQIGLLTAPTSEHRKQLFLFPFLRYTHYDRLGLGFALHNLSLPNRPFQFYSTAAINPLSGGVSGTGRFRWSIPLQQEGGRGAFLRLGVDGRYFPYDETEGTIRRYAKWSPYIQWDRTYGRYRHTLELRGHGINLDESRPGQNLGSDFFLPELYYRGEVNHPLRRYRWESWGTVLPDHFRLGLKLSYRQAYREKCFWSLRWYNGWIPKNYQTVPEAARLQAGRFSGADDFRFSEHWLGRSVPAGRGLAGLQSSQLEGTLKSPFRPNLHIEFLSTVELRIDAPWRWLPVALYADVGYISGTDAQSLQAADENWLFSPGLSLSFWDRLIEVHFPFQFWDSPLIQNNRPGYYENASWPTYINFSVRWDRDLFLDLDRRLLRP